MPREMTLLTNECLGTEEWRRLYDVYKECLRWTDCGEVLPAPIAIAVEGLVAFYAALGRDRSGASSIYPSRE